MVSPRQISSGGTCITCSATASVCATGTSPSNGHPNDVLSVTTTGRPRSRAAATISWLPATPSATVVFWLRAANPSLTGNE